MRRHCKAHLTGRELLTMLQKLPDDVLDQLLYLEDANEELFPCGPVICVSQEDVEADGTVLDPEAASAYPLLELSRAFPSEAELFAKIGWIEIEGQPGLYKHKDTARVRNLRDVCTFCPRDRVNAGCDRWHPIHELNRLLKQRGGHAP